MLTDNMFATYLLSPYICLIVKETVRQHIFLQSFETEKEFGRTSTLFCELKSCTERWLVEFLIRPDISYLIFSLYAKK